MAGAGRRLLALALIPAAAGLTACASSGGGKPAAGGEPAAARVVPQRIMQAPKSLLAAAQPQSDGTMWALAGRLTTGLFRLSAASRPAGSIPVSNSARSVAESAAGVLGLALGTRRSGALELLDGRTGKVSRTIPLPAPAREVVSAGAGPSFYVLSAWTAAATVTVVSSRNGSVRASVPVPPDAVSIAPDAGRGSVYVLEKTGLVEEIGIPDGRISARFRVGGNGQALALSPDGGTLYVLKGTPEVSNIAVVDLATEDVRRVLPAPSHCRGLLVSRSGSQLYEVVGTSGYGNIQVFAL